MSTPKTAALALLAWPLMLFAQSDYHATLSFTADFDFIDTAASNIQRWERQPGLKLQDLKIHREKGSLRNWKNTLYERHLQPETIVFGLDMLGNPDTSEPLPPEKHEVPTHPENATWKQDENTGEIRILYGEDKCEWIEHENNIKQLQVLQRLYYNRAANTMMTELFWVGLAVKVHRSDREGHHGYRAIGYQTVTKAGEAPIANYEELEANHPLRSDAVTWAHQRELLLSEYGIDDWEISAGNESKALKRIFNQSLVTQLVQDVKAGRLDAWTDRGATESLNPEAVVKALTQPTTFWVEELATGEQKAFTSEAELHPVQLHWIELDQEWQYNATSGELACVTKGGTIMHQQAGPDGQPLLTPVFYVRFVQE